MGQVFEVLQISEGFGHLRSYRVIELCANEGT